MDILLNQGHVPSLLLAVGEAGGGGGEGRQGLDLR